MNNLSKLACAVVGVAIMSSCDQQGASQETSASTPTATTSESAEKAEKIVYVNSDTLSEKYAYFQDIRTKLEAKIKKAQSDLQSKGQAFQREIADYQQKAATMSASDRQATEERLARKQDELGRLDQNASQSIAQDEATEYEAVYKTITDYLKKHAEDNGYKLVLTYSRGNPTVLYADGNMDITQQVITGLNEEYKKKKDADSK